MRASGEMLSACPRFCPDHVSGDLALLSWPDLTITFQWPGAWPVAPPYYSIKPMTCRRRLSMWNWRCPSSRLWQFVGECKMPDRAATLNSCEKAAPLLTGERSEGLQMKARENKTREAAPR